LTFPLLRLYFRGTNFFIVASSLNTSSFPGQGGIPAGKPYRRKRTVLGRIVNRERPVVVLFAIHKIARERQPKHVWAIRTKLQMEKQTRDLALYRSSYRASAEDRPPGPL